MEKKKGARGKTYDEKSKSQIYLVTTFWTETVTLCHITRVLADISLVRQIEPSIDFP